MDYSVLYSPLVGGVFIGLASGLYFLFLGKISGISGLLSRCFGKKGSSDFSGLYFLAGLLISGFAFKLMEHPSFSEAGLSQPLYLMAPAGLLVGVGTVLGNGCTSGHGVCGIGRFSFRSLVSTVIFMATAVLVVFLKKQLQGA